MKRLFPLMFVCMFAGQAFAAQAEVVATEVASKDVVVNEEVAKAEAIVVFNALKESGLSNGEIVALVKDELKSETTENEYRSVLKKSNQEKIVWMLVGAAITGGTILAVKYGIPAIKSAFAGSSDKNKNDKSDDKSGDKSGDKSDDKSGDKSDDKSGDKSDDKSDDKSGDKSYD
jgi:hypothetical protein